MFFSLSSSILVENNLSQSYSGHSQSCQNESKYTLFLEVISASEIFPFIFHSLRSM